MEIYKMKFSYDKLGKISSIHIFTNNIWAEVPWNPLTKLIDWDSIVYQPTLRTIKTAWDEWAYDKDLEIELRDRPDLVPAPPKQQPNWTGFNTQMVSNKSYGRVANQSTNQRAVNRLEALSIGNTSNFEFYKIFWNQMIEGVLAKLIPEEVQSWNSIAKANNMPFEFGLTGEMILHDPTN